ncbi:hypothetical protein AB0G29_13070 [Streptomyces parvus]|uniref:hypothetical protein n=1 Tax=Streptomyces parvus TaxID=66428 RepID=UPI00340D9BF9
MHDDDQEAGPRLRHTSQPGRAAQVRHWRQDAATELEELRDLYPLFEGLEVPRL